MLPPEPVALRPGEIVSGRPFTDLAQIAADFTALDRMRATLRAALQTVPTDLPPGSLLHPPEPDGRPHRVVLLSRALLLSDGPLAVVGFFGQRRQEVDEATLGTIDAELIDELRSHPLMLSYSSCQLACGGWANLVLLADPQGARRWRESARHSYAASQVAPRYYATIRIHNGALPAGLASPALRHTRTLYYDFRAGAWWHAVREAAPSAW
jgi:hypothetical protein